MERNRRFHAKLKQPLPNIDGTGICEDARELARLGKTKGGRRVGISGRSFDVARHYFCDEVSEWVEFALVPDDQRQRSARLCYAQHLAKSSKRTGKEHGPEPTNYHVKRVVTKRKRVGTTPTKNNVRYSTTMRVALGGLNHLRYSVSAHHRAAWSDRLRDT